MGHDQDIVKQLQRCFKNWNPNRRCIVHSGEQCCKYIGPLYELHLCGLGLEQLPAEVEQLVSLKVLYLSNNQLRSFPTELGNLSSLTRLHFDHNQCRTLPGEVGNLSALKSLNLSHNLLRELPAELGNLSALEYLDLSYNQLRTLPAELENLSSLWELHLDYNHLVTLPVELGNARSLEYLYLRSNPLPENETIRRQGCLNPKYEISSYLRELPKQPAYQLADRPSLSEDRLVSPQLPDISREQDISNTKETVPLKIFYCYAHEDKDLRDRIDKHLGTLKRLGHVIGWYDREIQAGTEWEREIETHLSTASIILLLVSADFVNSDYCYGVEMHKALKMHEKGETRVLPILLRPVDWQGAPFAKLQILPTGAKPITSWSDPEEALEDVAKQVRAVVSTLRGGQS